MPINLWACGFCGMPERDRRYGEYRHAPSLIVMAVHAYESHKVEPHELAHATVHGKIWVLPDGRVWIRKDVPSAG